MARSFNDIVADLEMIDGLAGRLSDELRDLVAAVTDTGKPGTLTLTLSVAPNGGGSVMLTNTIKAKVPEPKRPSAFFFTDSEGGLHRRDPNQPDLPLREIPHTAKA